MTPKQTALFNMAKLVGVGVLAGAVTSALLMTVPLAILGIAGSVVLLGFLAKMIYDLELSKAEHLEALNKLNNPKG